MGVSPLFFLKMIFKDLVDSSTVWLTLSFAGVKVYRTFYTEEREKSYGVFAISVSKPSAQPYTTMTDILAVSATLYFFFQNLFHKSCCHLIHYHYWCTFFSMREEKGQAYHISTTKIWKTPQTTKEEKGTKNKK